MKQCTWCGAQYSDEKTICSIDQHPLREAETKVVAATVSIPLKHLLFSFKGRLPRAPFWWANLILAPLSFAAQFAFSRMLESQSINSTALWGIEIVWWVLGVWIFSAIHVKRWHDLGWSGWMVLIVLVPLNAPAGLNLIGNVAFTMPVPLTILAGGALIYLGFWRGKVGPNLYGQESGCASKELKGA